MSVKLIADSVLVLKEIEVNILTFFDSAESQWIDALSRWKNMIKTLWNAFEQFSRLYFSSSSWQNAFSQAILSDMIVSLTEKPIAQESHTIFQRVWQENIDTFKALYTEMKSSTASDTSLMNLYGWSSCLSKELMITIASRMKWQDYFITSESYVRLKLNTT